MGNTIAYACGCVWNDSGHLWSQKCTYHSNYGALKRT